MFIYHYSIYNSDLLLSMLRLICDTKMMTEIIPYIVKLIYGMSAGN